MSCSDQLQLHSQELEIKEGIGLEILVPKHMGSPTRHLFTPTIHMASNSMAMATLTNHMVRTKASPTNQPLSNPNRLKTSPTNHMAKTSRPIATLTNLMSSLSSLMVMPNSLKLNPSRPMLLPQLFFHSKTCTTHVIPVL